MAANRVAHAFLKLIKVFRLREDGSAHGYCGVATFRRVLDEENHLAHYVES